MEEEMEVHRATVEEKVAALKEKNDEKHNLQADIDRLSRDIMKAVESQEKKREEVAALERVRPLKSSTFFLLGTTGLGHSSVNRLL